MLTPPSGFTKILKIKIKKEQKEKKRKKRSPKRIKYQLWGFYNP